MLENAHAGTPPEATVRLDSKACTWVAEGSDKVKQGLERLEALFRGAAEAKNLKWPGSAEDS